MVVTSASGRNDGNTPERRAPPAQFSPTAAMEVVLCRSYIPEFNDPRILCVRAMSQRAALAWSNGFEDHQLQTPRFRELEDFGGKP